MEHSDKGSMSKTRVGSTWRETGQHLPISPTSERGEKFEQYHNVDPTIPTVAEMNVAGRTVLTQLIGSNKHQIKLFHEILFFLLNLIQSDNMRKLQYYLAEQVASIGFSYPSARSAVRADIGLQHTGKG